ncbi:MAG TPA: sigma-54 dependent transcriptional regulator [Polyangiaceae bacterium]|nr:sigma-54 dependent transcriptional regulator [Polyangiaceae bacterium]
MPNVLLVDAEAGRTAALIEALGRSGHTTRHVTTGEAGLAALEAELFDLILTDSEAVDAGGRGLLGRLAERWPELPVVVLTPRDDEAKAAEALRGGAADALATPIVAEEVAFVVAKALSAASTQASKPPRQPSHDSLLLGESDGMKKLRELLKRTAAGTATTLIRGETGTGKELVARALHASSPRRDRPFVKIDCASLPDTLLESELFGYERGAFTGAVSRKIGRVELAERGTLFLDEIGEISLVLQAKLLRLLQDREFERLGSRSTQRIDVRFVLATHRDLDAMVENGTFRHDLFQRFNVVTLWIPPLRARREDIELLAREFTRRFAAANAKPNLVLSPEALRLLRSQRWPGNVRQLENFIERLVVLTDAQTISGAEVEREFVQKPEFLTQRTEGTFETLTEQDGAPPQALADAVRRAEKAALLAALKRAAGNRSVAARVLGVSRATLYNKLKELGIEQQ